MKHCTICKAKYDDSVSFCPVDGEVLEDDPSSLVDTVLDGQYQIEAMLGKGGMGAVYSARHILLGDRVAIKILPPEVRNNAEWLRRFRREGQAARRFRHPNAVTVYDLRTAADGTIYMVMEYVEGHTIDAEIKKRGRFTASEAFETLEPILSVLDTAHSMGVVHRDLKPENIMVGKPTGNGERVVKLLDLGIAKMREIAGVDTGGNTALTMAGQVLGTPYYMSPEQWGEIPRDGSPEIDGRADIYSLGLVFYEMIAGRRCYLGATLHELRREHVSTTPRPLHEVVPDVPRRFSDALVRAIAKDRGDRQSTAKEFCSELRVGLGSPTADFQAGNSGTQAGSLAETMAVPGGLETNSAVNAPTIITLNPAATAAPSVERGTPVPTNGEAFRQQPVFDHAGSMSAPTIAESGDADSILTVPQDRSRQRDIPMAVAAPQAQLAVPAARGKSALLIGVVVVVVILAVAGVGGFLIYNYNWSKSKPNTVGAGTNANSSSVATAPAPREISRYWLELEKPSANVAGLVPIASGQSLKLHFVFSEDGYVYLVGPGGNNNQPTLFLTAKPPAGSGLTSNQATQGADFSFPSGTNWLTLDNKPGAEDYTVIFSKAPLTVPAFFAALANPAEPLTPEQQEELRQFIAKYKEKPPKTELDESNSGAPFVRVKVLPDQVGNPIVFDVRIQHN
jgi:serine/threonine protein kinase